MFRKVIVFCLIAIFSFSAHFSSVFAQEIAVSTTPTPTPIEYNLPYPGILPGSPFYFLKTIRDNLMDFLISNPLKKAEFDLLQSDKDLQSVIYLSEQNKDSKVISQTLNESGSFFQKAIDKTNEAKKQGINTTDFTAKITIASLKHQEIITGLLKSAKADAKKTFEISLENFKNFAKDLKTLQLK